MKINLFHFIFAVLLAGFMSQGFQCGSPEFTGAKIQEQKKNYPESAKLYEKEVLKNPSNQEAWFRLGCIRGEQLNDYAGMMAAFREVEKISPEFSKEIQAYRYRGWALHINEGVLYKKRASADSLEFYDKAIEEYKISIDIWPDTSLTYLYLAEAYQGKGDIENVILSQKKVWELDHNIDAYKRTGGYIIQQGLQMKEQFNSDNAEKLRIQKALNKIDIGSYNTDVTQAFGTPDIQKKDKKNPKREDWKYNQYALTFTIEGEKVVGKNIEKKIDLKIDSTKYYEAVDQFNKAVDICETIKAANPKDNENLNLLLQAYFEANRIKEATKAFKLAVDNDPGNKMNHYILGILYRMVDDYTGSIEEFNEAVKIDPTFSDAFFDLGATYYNWGVKLKNELREGDESIEYKKKFEQSLPWMEKVVQIKKNDPKVWDTLGTIYAQLGQTEKAMQALDEADKLRKAGK